MRNENLEAAVRVLSDAWIEFEVERLRNNHMAVHWTSSARLARRTVVVPGTCSDRRGKTRAAADVRRILIADGEYTFIERGRAIGAKVEARQKYLRDLQRQINALQKKIDQSKQVHPVEKSLLEKIGELLGSERIAVSLLALKCGVSANRILDELPRLKIKIDVSSLGIKLA